MSVFNHVFAKDWLLLVRVNHEEKESTGSSQAGARSRSNSTGIIIADLPRCYFTIALRYLVIIVT